MEASVVLRGGNMGSWTEPTMGESLHGKLKENNKAVVVRQRAEVDGSKEARLG